MSNRTTALVVGVFDILSVAHYLLLENAYKTIHILERDAEGKSNFSLTVALNSDKSVQQCKKKNEHVNVHCDKDPYNDYRYGYGSEGHQLLISRPIVGFDKRKEMLLATGYVDEVVEFDTLTPIELVKQLKPKYVVKGIDYARANNYATPPEALDTKVIYISSHMNDVNLHTTDLIQLFINSLY